MDQKEPDREVRCAEVRDLLTALEGDLSPGEKAALERHLEVCGNCRRALEEHRGVWDLMAKASHPVPRLSDAEFLSALRGRIRRGGILRRTAAAAAAAAFVIGAGLLWLPSHAGDDLAVIENIDVLQAIEAVQEEESADAADLGRILIGMLEEEETEEGEAGEAGEDLVPDDLDALLDPSGKESGRQG